MGAWIEIILVTSQAGRELVASRMGAWIEMALGRGVLFTSGCRLPYGGVD